MKEDVILEVRGLRKQFREQQILDGVDITFSQGKDYCDSGAERHRKKCAYEAPYRYF